MSHPAPSELPSWLENSCVSLCAAMTTHWGKKNRYPAFLPVCGGPFPTLTCERAFSRHQFDVYCIKRGRAWPRENIKASSIRWSKKKKIAQRKFITQDDDNGWDGLPFFFCLRGTGQRRWKETIPVQFRSILLFSSLWRPLMVGRISRR